MAKVQSKKGQHMGQGAVEEASYTDVEATGLASESAAADDVIVPEQDIETEEKLGKKFPDDVWQNVSDRDVRIGIGRPIRIRPGQKVMITSAYRRAVRTAMGTFEQNDKVLPTLVMVEGEDVINQGLISKDDRPGMEIKDPVIDTPIPKKRKSRAKSQE